MKRTRAIVIVLAAVFCLTAAGFYLARSSVLPLLASWLDVGEPPHVADYVFVLGGDLEVRPFVAAALCKAKLARKVFVPQVCLSPEVEAGVLPPWDELVKRVLVYRGVRGENVIPLGHEINSTYDEARALVEFLRAHPAVRVTVVTSNFHTRRARWIFSQVLGHQMDRVSVFSAPTEGFQADNWWRSEDGFLMIVGENLKFASYVLCYGHFAWWLAGIACAIGLFVVGRRWCSTRIRSHPTDDSREIS